MGPHCCSPSGHQGNCSCWCFFSLVMKTCPLNHTLTVDLIVSCLLSVKQEIEECAALLEKECVALSPQLGALRLLPLHAGLGGLTQRIYESDPNASTLREDGSSEDSSALGAGGVGKKRKVILTDALAEASFSLPGVRYVIDMGLQLKNVSLFLYQQQYFM